MNANVDWTIFASQLEGPGFAQFQIALTKFNGSQLDPLLPMRVWDEELAAQSKVARAEIDYIEAVRRAVAPLTADIPAEVDAFIAWYEHLHQVGPGQGDPLFPWLATAATRAQMRWFLFQEVAGEAGFEDLLAMTQVKMPVQAKLEMARNYWDEMGRGSAKGMHGGMLATLAEHLEVAPTPDEVVPESLALGNAMIAMARHRAYAFHSVGALGVIEMTAPVRADYVNKALTRLRVPAKK